MFVFLGVHFPSTWRCMMLQLCLNFFRENTSPALSGEGELQILTPLTSSTFTSYNFPLNISDALLFRFWTLMASYSYVLIFVSSFISCLQCWCQVHTLRLTTTARYSLFYRPQGHNICGFPLRASFMKPCTHSRSVSAKQRYHMSKNNISYRLYSS